ncbi:MAG: hypothetical protein JWP49_532, partial [Phenylobacterium sp.]|nr:hypothetical protein [Phenylobacterium sp.]
MGRFSLARPTPPSATDAPVETKAAAPAKPAPAKAEPAPKPARAAP